MNDRVTEAFYGAMGERLQENTRKRLFWICERAKGEFILDIGCSQGICSILLGREGFNVIGIDMDSQAIAFAQGELQKEERSTQEKVCFLTQNFMDYEASKQADTIILSEILEHLTHPDKVLQRALAMLRDHGTMIVTLPFGVNDYPDHKHTYYLQDAYKLLSDCSSIREIEIFGKWIGFLCEKSGQPSIPIDDELVDRVEAAIENTERSNQHQIAILNKSVEQYKKNYETVRANEQGLDKKLKAAETQLAQKDEELAELSAVKEKELSKLTSQKDAEMADQKTSYENALAAKDGILKASKEHEFALLQELAQSKLTMEALKQSLRDIQMDVSENEQNLLSEIKALKKLQAEAAEKEKKQLLESSALKKLLAEAVEKEKKQLLASNALRKENKEALSALNSYRIMEHSRIGRVMMKVFFSYHKLRGRIGKKL